MYKFTFKITAYLQTRIKIKVIEVIFELDTYFELKKILKLLCY